MRKLALIFALMFSLSFAAGAGVATVQPPGGVGATLASPATSPPWLSTALLAGVASLMILALLYIVGQGFDLQDLKFLAKEELYQLIATFLIIAVLQGAVSAFDEISKNFYGSNFHSYALNNISAEIDSQNKVFDNLVSFSVELGQESSKSFFCSIQGIGYSISPCSSFRALTAPVSMAFQTIALTLTELNSIKTLILFGQAYAFTLLLPAAILLRTFKLTRGAGGVLIGLAVAFYVFLPVGYMFMSELLTYSSTYSAPQPLASNFVCNSDEIGSSNLNEAKSVYTSLKANVEPYLFTFLIRGTLTAVISILIMITGMKAVSKIAGAEVDVSILSRIG